MSIACAPTPDGVARDGHSFRADADDREVSAPGADPVFQELRG